MPDSRLRRGLGVHTRPSRPQRAEVAIGHGEQVLALQEHLSAGYLEAAAVIPEERQRDRGLTRSGLANQPEHLARPYGKGHLVDDVGRRPRHDYFQTREDEPRAMAGHVDGKGGHRSASSANASRAMMPSARRSTPSATRATASLKVFVPTVSTAISVAGTTTAHGFSCSPIRFSLIMRPQLGEGGGWPKPRRSEEHTSELQSRQYIVCR